MKSLIKEIEDKFEEIEEANVTGNLDGGEGPVKTPHAFSKSKDEEDLDDEAAYGNESDYNEVEEVGGEEEDDSEDGEYEADDGDGSELSEEDYKYWIIKLKTI